MKELLDEYSIPSKIWMLHHTVKNKVHAILTFYLEGKVIYLELTPQSGKEFYGKELIYSTEEELINEYTNKQFDVVEITDLVIPSANPSFFYQ